MNNMVVADEWRENFRMFKENFMKLWDKVRPFLQKQSTNMRSPINVEKQVAVTLYYLSDEGSYLKVTNAFGIGKSTVSETVRRVCKCISIVLASNYQHQNKKLNRQLAILLCSWLSTMQRSC